MSKKALGKGISALIQNLDQNKEIDKQQILMIDTEKLKPNPYQPRDMFDSDSLKELADSIMEKGIIQPLIAEDNGNETYTIIAGERRLKAAKMTG